jgi:hypothetical protein
MVATPALSAIQSGNFRVLLLFREQVKSEQDIAPLVSLVYFRSEEAGLPKEPYISDFSLQDFHDSKCGWDVEDCRYFDEWLDTPRNRDWLAKTFQELKAAAEEAKPVVPETLKRVMESDD